MWQAARWEAKGKEAAEDGNWGGAVTAYREAVKLVPESGRLQTALDDVTTKWNVLDVLSAFAATKARSILKADGLTDEEIAKVEGGREVRQEERTPFTSLKELKASKF